MTDYHSRDNSRKDTDEMGSETSQMYEQYLRASAVDVRPTSAEVMTREDFDEALRAVQLKIDAHLERATFPVSVNRLSRALSVPEILVQIIAEANPSELILAPEGNA